MQYTVPQFIEHEAKIVGPLTFKQFVYLGAAGVVAFVLYYSLPFAIFVILAVLLGMGAMALAFVRVGGRNLPEMIKNFLTFSSSPKIYLWKKGAQPRLIKKAPEPKEIKEEKESAAKIGGESKLHKLSTKIETK
ncbi:MAG: PrgI family protein [Candidatus Nealsonbacteria bacterium]|nr:PrgI family protein [Candidatus Nealsonbacteria bacterium]